MNSVAKRTIKEEKQFEYSLVLFPYTYQEDFLLSGEAKAKDFADFKEAGRKGLESQIMLANEIATVYESNYGYFKANCRFKVHANKAVDSFEKLQQIRYAKPVSFSFSFPDSLLKRHYSRCL